MTAPLYEVKRKFSDYVKLAEQGEIISVTKYGKPTVIVISLENFEEAKKEPHRESFAEAYAAWRKRWPVDPNDIDNTTPWDNIRSKECYERKNIWDD